MSNGKNTNTFLFKQEVANAVRNFDKSIINRIMLPEAYPVLNNNEKNIYMFEMALEFMHNMNTSKAEKFLNYLVFDYDISEDIYHKIENKYKNKLVIDLMEELFGKRRINKELGKELNINGNNNKRIKV